MQRHTFRPIQLNLSQMFVSFSILLVIGLSNSSIEAKTGKFEQAPPDQGDTPYVVNDDKGIALVHLPGGTFQMGVSADEAVKTCQDSWPEGYDTSKACSKDTLAEFSAFSELKMVTTSPFYMDQFEVSLSSYLDCVHADVCGATFLSQEMEAIASGDTVPMNVPVSGSNYYDAAIYCAWRDARLPTEEEWECAARGTNSTNFPWGNEFDGARTNFCDANCQLTPNSQWNDGYMRKAPIDAFPKGQSWAGIYNLSGNVAEWTSTQNLDEFGRPIDSGRVVKGGNYESLIYETAAWFRILVSDIGGGGDKGIGFRCVRTTQP